MICHVPIRLAAATGAWICFEDESGQALQPPVARTWGRRGHTPVVWVSGRGSGRISVAGLACVKAGQPGRFFYRMRGHRLRPGRAMSEADYAGLITAAHRYLDAPVIVIWDYVPRNIIPVLCPAVLCGRRRVVSLAAADGRLGGAAAGHIIITVRRAS